MDIIIDGYNLIGADQGLCRQLEAQRMRLIQKIQNYQRLKGYNLFLIFDGWRQGSNYETSAKEQGLTIIYSRRGVKADQVIIDLARAKGAGCVVVSSDREICRAIERFGAVSVPAVDFHQILLKVDRVVGGGSFDPGESGDYAYEEFGGERRGMKLSKVERRRIEKIKKLQL